MYHMYGTISELILDQREHPVTWNVRGRRMVVQCRGKRFLFPSKFRQYLLFAPFPRLHLLSIEIDSHTKHY
jgi:hypothetical protein